LDEAAGLLTAMAYVDLNRSAPVLRPRPKDQNSLRSKHAFKR
jgi:hypothetical protein